MVDYLENMRKLRKKNRKKQSILEKIKILAHFAQSAMNP